MRGTGRENGSEGRAGPRRVCGDGSYFRRERQVRGWGWIPIILDLGVGGGRDFGRTLEIEGEACLPIPPFTTITAIIRLVRPDSSIRWSGYPSLLLASAFAGGVVGASLLNISLSVWLCGMGGGLVVFVGVQWWDRRRLVTLAPLGRVVAVVLVTAGAGGVRYTFHQAPSPRNLARLVGADGRSLGVQGTVATPPARTEEATRFTLTVDTALGRGDTAAVAGRVRVTLRPSPWSDHAGSFPTVRQGDRVRLRGVLRRPEGKRNPGGFDYRSYLARRGVCCTMYVGAPGDVRVGGHRRGVVQAAVVAVRGHVRRQVRRYVPSNGGRAVLQALLLGDRSRVTDAQRERFAQTGLLHLLAVSGLHVFLVGMVFYVLLRPLLMRVRLRWWGVEATRAALTVVVLGLYMLLTGGRPSVVRAVLMATLLIGGILFQRSTHSLNTLGLAALILMAVRPTALFDVGFQLSMAAVAGIVTLNPRLLEMVPPRYRNAPAPEWLVSTATVSAAAILGTAPVLLYHFGWVSAAGLLLNITGIPCTGLALSAAILMALTGGGMPVAGAAFGSAADLFVHGLLATSRYGADWLSWAGVRMAAPNLWVLGVLMALLVALAQWARPRTRWRWLIVGLLLATISVWGKTMGRTSAPTLDLLFFDVGQGGATLIATPAGQHVLVDTGPWSPTGSAAAFSVLPYLERRGIRRLSAVVITHPDEDHLGGLPTLLREVSVGRVIHNGWPADTELYASVRELLSQKQVPEQVVGRGDTLRLGAASEVQVLSPPQNASGWHPTDRNNASLVLRLAFGKTRVLLPGDIETTTEARLVRVYGEQLASHVVKIPHHGSVTSSTPGFVDAVSGENRLWAVVSVGRKAQYGMPSQNVLARWRRHEATVRSTASQGAVWMRTNGSSVWQVLWK